MQDISEDLTQIINAKQCSSLLAFIVVKNGIHIYESESDEQPSRRLCDQRDINTNR